jgi:hypothetical protein
MRNPDLHKSPLTKAIFLWLLFFLPGPFSFSQTTNISGIVNSYYTVMGVNHTTDAVRLSNTLGLSAGDRVLLVQMRGASILDTTVTLPIWGDTTSLNNAGNYEMAIICLVTPDSAYFIGDIMNNYTPAGTVQLVKFGEYVNANVTDTLRAAPWSSIANVGGVLAIYVEGDLTLSSGISANRTGFAGGAHFTSNTSCTNFISNYAYNASVAVGTAQNGAFKGDGVATPPAGRNGGRGALANGAGGGNNHNNGGGGGANLARGGIGGGNSSTTGCSASFPGGAGKALSNWGGKKIFLGGGGGAGHNNNAVLTSQGGNGGGIIIIHANRIIGNGHTISTNGGIGNQAQSDGAGGGGAAGTIIMEVPAGYQNVTIQANGGDGGLTYDGGNIRRCYAAGGGGSGGALYFFGATPSNPGVSVAVAPGVGGAQTGSDALCAPPVLPAAGNAGVITNSYSIRISSSITGYCSQVLPVRLTLFKATPIEKKVKLQWNISSPEEAAGFEVQKTNVDNRWETISTITAHPLQSDYTSTDENALPGYNSYRLKVIAKNGAIYYSLIRRVYIESENDGFALYPNPAHDKLFIKANYNGFIDLKLLDVTGKPVMLKRSRMNMGVKIDLPSLSAGVYILYINNAMKKLVIQ